MQTIRYSRRLFDDFLRSHGYDADADNSYQRLPQPTGTLIVCLGHYAFKFFPSTIPLDEKRRRFEIEVEHQALFDTPQRVVFAYFAVSKSGGRNVIVDPSDARNIVDYVLFMRRLNAEDSILERINAGLVDVHFGNVMAGTLIKFHSRCEIIFDLDEIRAISDNELMGEEKDIAVARELLSSLSSEAFSDRTHTLELLDGVDQYFSDTRKVRRNLLLTRGSDNLLRDVHGDLHIDNWSMMEGHLVLPDVMPYDRYRRVDLLRDVVRVLIELRGFGLEHVAEAFNQRYFLLHPEAFSAPLIKYFVIRLSLADLTTQLGRAHQRDAAFSRSRMEFWMRRREMLWQLLRY